VGVHHAEDGRGADRARGRQNRDGTERTKKRRSGGAGNSSGADVSATIPEDEWGFVVSDIATKTGQDWWDVYDCKPHGQPHLTWFAFYHLSEYQRIQDLRREVDDFDHAATIGCAVNDGKAMEKRQSALMAKLRRAPVAVPQKKDFTHEEMQAAANYMLSLTGKTSKPMPS